jgi:hypothetical protein
MTDKPYELSALDFSILRIALRAHLEKVRKLFPEDQLATEDLIERFDNADGCYMEVNV